MFVGPSTSANVFVWKTDKFGVPVKARAPKLLYVMLMDQLI